jgi:hypothetical protein
MAGSARTGTSNAASQSPHDGRLGIDLERSSKIVGLNAHPDGAPDTRQLRGPPEGPTQRLNVAGFVVIVKQPAGVVSAAVAELAVGGMGGSLMLFTKAVARATLSTPKPGFDTVANSRVVAPDVISQYQLVLVESPTMQNFPPESLSTGEPLIWMWWVAMPPPNEMYSNEVEVKLLPDGVKVHGFVA